ncbi:BREX-1 system adenine-specific DNA-methyltransferase PglX [Clostridiaceae bacterium HFYG-1003]|nr:BREX-1 system adenine-specific DNA-methyltransferase PglX [Clostridiaceae bacterium HFYG-1003]
MNKTAIKNFAIWARNKLIADISYKAGLLGITEKGIKSPLPQSTQTVQFFDIGTKEPSSITGIEIQQRKKLVEEIERKATQSDYATAYKNVIEEVAYTWFNRLIAIRFMEVNDYLPTRIRVLSSESNGKAEPDLVTLALEASLDYSAYEKDRIIQLKHENKLDELFRMLFIKQCNALNANLPELFEKTSDYTELLLNVSFTDKEGVIYHLVNDIDEGDFNVSKEGQVEIIGWLYQYYNTEPKDETFALLKKNVKITKERIPAATQLFTPDWIVRYMVENSLGRLWLEGHPNDELKAIWKYFMDEAEQEDDVQNELDKIREEYKAIKPEDIKVIDPAMGSGHILVYAFDVLMQIYESHGYSQRDAAKNIIEKNLYGLDIDNRAYQLAYFAVMMKARQYNRRILNGETICHLYAIKESNDIDRSQLKYFGAGLSTIEKNTALLQMRSLLDCLTDAKEFGSIISVENFNWQLLRNFIKIIDAEGQMSLDTIGIEVTREQLRLLIEIGEVLARKYDIVVTNPPYMSNKGMSKQLSEYIQNNYKDSKVDLFAVFIERCNAFTKPNCFQSMITQHSWMFLSSLENLRLKTLRNDIMNMAHLGARAFEEIGGEVVQTTSFILRKALTKNYISTFCKLLSYGSQSEKETAYLNKRDIFYSTKKNFEVIPGTPLSYWLSEKASRIYDTSKKFGDINTTRAGMITGNNEIFVRLWHEVANNKSAFSCASREEAVMTSATWFPYSKGGEFRRWYGNNDCVVNWHNDGEFMRTYKDENGKIPAHAFNLEYIFKENICWNSLSSYRFSARYTQKGFLYDAGGSFASITNTKYVKFYLGFLNSNTAFHYLSALNPTMNFQKGNVADLPIKIDPVLVDKVREIVDLNIELSKSDWDSFEISWDFRKHPLVNGLTIYSAYENWKNESYHRFIKMKENEEELNSLFINLYGLHDEVTSDVCEDDVTVRRADLKRDVRSFISYAVGCLFGRYSLDTDGLAYAGGEWDDSKYYSFIPDKDNILPITDEEYFKDDIIGLFIKFVKKVFGEDTLENNLNFIATALDNNGNSSREVIRNYFVKEFFKDHCKIYQKRPIYWLFDSGKQNGFKGLVYMHRYDENTIGNLRIDYLHRVQRIYENEIARMQDAIEISKDAREVAAATKRKEKLIKQLQETKEYDEKIAHLALARTSIDLDDGVKINYEKVQTDRDGKKLDVLAKI